MDNNTFKWAFPSDTFYFVTDSLSIAIMLATLILFFAFCFIVVRYSPVEMKVYKWYLLANHALFLVLELGEGIAHPKLILPISALALDGYLLKMYNSAKIINYNTMVSIFIIGVFMLIVAYVLTITLLFIFRYAQTLNILLLKRLLSSSKSILLYVSIDVGISLSVFFIVNQYMIFDDELKEQYRMLYPEIYKRIENRVLQGIKVTFC